MLRKNASRLRVISTADLSASESMHALYHLRKQFLGLSNEEGSGANEGNEIEDQGILRRVYEMVGGRTSYLVRVARADDMLAEAEGMVRNEMRWLGSK
jgi:hypothetical protein